MRTRTGDEYQLDVPHITEAKRYMTAAMIGQFTNNVPLCGPHILVFILDSKRSLSMIP
jgi:hypothetical protein